MAIPRNHDRVHFTPPHGGAKVLPNSPFLIQLLRHAQHTNPPTLCVRDLNISEAGPGGLEKTYTDLVQDIINVRNEIDSRLDPTTRETLRLIRTGAAQKEEVFVGILAIGGYEYVVALLAVFALGAAAVPMSTALPVEEAAYFVTKSQQIAILASRGATPLARSIVEHLKSKGAEGAKNIHLLQSISVYDYIGRDTPSPSEIVISSDDPLDENAAGVVIFTSGTTGPPKGAVLPRRYITEASRAVADLFSLTRDDVNLHLLPVHHVTGLAINVLPFLIAGSTIEFKTVGGFDPKWTWERWRKGGLTLFSGVPTIFMRLMRHYEHRIANLPQAERREYDDAANQFRIVMCGTSALPRPVSDFWTSIRGGRRIVQRYGSTEIGAVVAMKPGAENTPEKSPDGSVGEIETGVDLKLANGEDGEILVKSPYLFTRYLFDDKATAESFNEDGFFKTGDIARREGKYYFIEGRASQDILKSGGYKISALDIEREILSLPYISEVIVVGVSDMEFGQRVGAILTLREDQDQYSVQGTKERPKLTVEHLRKDLRSRLAGYKMPTLLRVIEGELPKTASGKVLKKILGPQYLPSPGWEKERDVQAWNKEASKL